MKTLCVIIAMALFGAVYADEALGISATNEVVISNEITTKAWRRDYAAIRNGKELIDASGIIAAKADAVAVSYVATNATLIADAAHTALTNSVAELATATNDIPACIESFSLQFIRKSPANLMGHVVDGWFDGTYDWQAVRYSKYIAKAPKRSIVYTTPSGSVSAECEWDEWVPKGITRNGYGGVHICKAERPTTLRSAKILPRIKDVFGGDQGFDFGSMTVFVDGAVTFTGTITGKTSNVTLTFDNGVLK